VVQNCFIRFKRFWLNIIQKCWKFCSELFHYRAPFLHFSDFFVSVMQNDAFISKNKVLKHKQTGCRNQEMVNCYLIFTRCWLGDRVISR